MKIIKTIIEYLLIWILLSSIDLIIWLIFNALIKYNEVIGWQNTLVVYIMYISVIIFNDYLFKFCKKVVNDYLNKVCN
jgi:hypothetical protein